MGLTDMLCPGMGQATPPKPSCPADWVTRGCRRQHPPCRDPCLVLRAGVSLATAHCHPQRPRGHKSEFCSQTTCAGSVAEMP